MTDHSDLQWNNDEIAKHLKSAVDTLTPDILDKIDLTTPQAVSYTHLDVYKRQSLICTGHWDNWLVKTAEQPFRSSSGAVSALLLSADGSAFVEGRGIARLCEPGQPQGRGASE